MGSAYLTALSGLSANSSAINVTANNLANLNTVGFKSQAVTFNDLLAGEMDMPGMTEAMGASPLAEMQFQQGGIESNQGPLDAAIDGGGFFVTSGARGPLYTRSGDFQVGQDAAGSTVLLSQSGNPVEGYAIGANGQLSTQMSEIVLPSANHPAVTTATQLQANLDPSTAAGGATSWSETIADAQGGAHTLTFDLVKGSSPGSWTLSTEVDGKATGDTAALQFDASGKLQSPSSFTIHAPGGQTISMPLMDPSGNGLLTQYASPTVLGSISQNGGTNSLVTGYSIGDGGLVLASCADGSTFNVAQLALAQIQNPQSLTSLSKGDYQVSANTMGSSALAGATGASPWYGTASAIGSAIVGGALEQSATNVSTELTNLMVYQRAYEANSKAITTNDQMQETLYDLVA